LTKSLENRLKKVTENLILVGLQNALILTKVTQINEEENVYTYILQNRNPNSIIFKHKNCRH
jgi:hypothetical protein